MSDASTPNTTVAEDRADPPKKGRHLLLAIAGSLVILFAGVLTLLFALDSGDNGQAPKVTPDQLAQQAFDQRQQAKAQRKADSLADQPFVDRGQPGDSPSSELEKLLEQNRRENETGVDSGNDPSPEEVDRRANRMSLVERILKRQQAEEENPSAAYPNRYVYDTRENGLNERKYEEATAGNGPKSRNASPCSSTAVLIKRLSTSTARIPRKRKRPSTRKRSWPRSGNRRIPIRRLDLRRNCQKAEKRKRSIQSSSVSSRR